LRAPPAEFFTTGEKAVWRNLASWAWQDDEWVDLPGPASWWPKSDAQIDATGFHFSTKSPEGHKEAILVMYAAKEPEDGSYQRVFPSDSEFWVMEDTVATQNYLRKFFRA
jgi:hypothetical protein